MNIWAILAGVFLYSRYHKTSFHRYLYIGLYGTSLSPIMTQIMQIGHLPHECFAVLFLDAQHRVLQAVEMFRGTLTQTSVYPREVVIEALARQAAAVILAHNHPSGHSQPSQADQLLTSTLKSALSLVDVRVLDHFIVTRSRVLSFAEQGLI